MHADGAVCSVLLAGAATLLSMVSASLRAASWFVLSWSWTAGAASLLIVVYACFQARQADALSWSLTAGAATLLPGSWTRPTPPCALPGGVCRLKLDC